MNEPCNATSQADAENAAAIAAYRQALIEAEKHGQESFDKTVLSLSGGALAISFVFIKDVIGPNYISHPGYLIGAWTCWAISTLAVLASFYFSNRGLRKAIVQCDEDKIYCEPPGGYFTTITRRLNEAGIVFLLIGIGCMAYFVYNNLLLRGIKDEPEANTTVTPNTATTPDTATARPENAGGRLPYEGLRSSTAAAQKEVKAEKSR